MNEPQINVDHFYHRPVYHVVGLLDDKSKIPAISRELESAGLMSQPWRFCAVSMGQPSWTSMTATTGCEAASCEPFSGSATTG
jgi:hypothetical protein